nr:G-type lectin S-receptor-like serine/threonine-protein kinase At4g27290 isoform X1 [Ipomoea batatas]
MADFHFHHLYLFLFSLIIFSILKISPARDTISLDDPLPENETIISSGGTFEMGIFSPSFTFSYVGIWYKNIPARPVVWVANRKVPLSKNVTSLVLKIVNSSHLALLSVANDVILSVNTSLSFSSPVMQLLDSGNLVVRDAGDENPGNFLWQSFDYPTNTYLPGMKMGINFETGHEVYLSAWKSAEDPSPSDYTSNLLVTGYPQGIIRQGKALICRSGPWNGVRWSGIPSPDINPIYNYVLVINKTEIYTNYSLVKKSVISVLYMNYTGVVHRLMWVEGMRDWITIGKLPTDDCDRYGNCGGNGLCNIGNFPVCGCLDHFLPRNQADWGMAKFAGGCVRKKSLECHTGKDPGGFLKYSGIKVPDTQNSWYNETMTLQECQQECLKNCNCTAFSSLDVRNGGSGCLMWFGDLVDIRQMSERGQDIYIRLASSELDPGLGSRREHRKILEIVAVTLSAVIGLFLISGLSLMLYVRRKKKIKFLRDEDFELPVFHLRTIARATNNFSADNKLGEGGFGPVYKGVLENGQEIAVKRLSKASVQGIHEFKNEVVFIAKLQHRNLVSILGCCIQGEEQMLIYEYMPNRSLDLFIFGMAYSEKPVFERLFLLIETACRHFLYVHQDS